MTSFSSYDGTQLWYEVTGDGPPLVCLPGGPGADARSLGTLGGLDARYTLVTLDGRAGGRSQIPADRASCSFAGQARDVEALRVHLGLSEPDLLAHSAGTLTAQEYAVRYGVRRLVLVTPAGRAAREPDPAEGAAIRAQGWSNAEPEDDYPAPPEWLRAAFYGTAESSSPRQLERLRTMRAPVLAVCGARDGIAGTHTSKLIGELYENCAVEILPAGGHWPWLDDPEGFRERVSRFLSE
ncbi:alpha/beta fold hydrolase [Longispora albida]|uniref:alpha/beta fold hydrolase n=1 Tax=Longispora albida TaxID=203523 RepID=UPI00037B7F36|nr:alpha/beta hydrolase [Longispora albida]